MGNEQWGWGWKEEGLDCGSLSYSDVGKVTGQILGAWSLFVEMTPGGLATVGFGESGGLEGEIGNMPTPPVLFFTHHCIHARCHVALQLLPSGGGSVSFSLTPGCLETCFGQ